MSWLSEAFGSLGKSSQSSSSKNTTDTTGRKFGETKQFTKQALAQATPFQKLAETTLFNALQGGYNPYTGQQQLAGQTNNLMNQLLSAGGLSATPQQQALLQGQTNTYMKGLADYLNDWQRGAMSQTEQAAMARGIPMSSIARGAESNVNAQVLKQLAQGYNQAMQRQQANELQLPIQNLQLMAGLQNQFNSPLLQQLYSTAMSRLAGPRDVTQTGNIDNSIFGTQKGTTSNKSTDQGSFLSTLGTLLNFGGQAGQAGGEAASMAASSGGGFAI